LGLASLSPDRNYDRRAFAVRDVVQLFGEGEVLHHKSVGTLSIATGEVNSTTETTQAITARAGKTITIKPRPRVGPMPHNGYRPFENVSSRRARRPGESRGAVMSIRWTHEAFPCTVTRLNWTL
jgi:hypothetical protein